MKTGIAHAQGAAIDALNALDELRQHVEQMGRASWHSEVCQAINVIRRINQTIVAEMNRQNE